MKRETADINCGEMEGISLMVFSNSDRAQFIVQSGTDDAFYNYQSQRP